MVSQTNNTNIKQYPWLHPYFNQLVATYHYNRWCHALLIRSLPGMGDNILVYAISKFLMCQQPKLNRSCDKCQSCQFMQLQTHPDYYIIQPDHGKSTLGIDTIRMTCEKIYTYSCLGGAKIVWIKNAVQLTSEAAHALLKILEEPPEKTWFFISCYTFDKLLSTIRSRCVLYHLKIPNESWTIRWITNHHKVEHSSEVLLTSLRLCSGAPLAAIEQLQPEIWFQRLKLCSTLSAVLKSGNWFNLYDALNKKKILQSLYWLSILLLDALKLQQNINLIHNIDVYTLIDELRNAIPNSVTEIIFRKICKVRHQLLTVSGLNYELIIINLLLDIERLITCNIASSHSRYICNEM